MSGNAKSTSDAPKGSGTAPIPGAQTDPSSLPEPGHGGDNSRGNRSMQGKEGNGGQKLQQKKKS